MSLCFPLEDELRESDLFADDREPGVDSEETGHADGGDAAAEELDLVHLASNHSWGHIRIAWRPPRSGLSCGSWFARCLENRLDDKTECNKQLSLAGTDDCHKRDVLIGIYVWCNRALELCWKRDHGGETPPSFHELLPWSVVQALLPQREPPRPLLPDAQLDDMEDAPAEAESDMEGPPPQRQSLMLEG